MFVQTDLYKFVNNKDDSYLLNILKIRKEYLKLFSIETDNPMDPQMESTIGL